MLKIAIRLSLKWEVLEKREKKKKIIDEILDQF